MKEEKPDDMMEIMKEISKEKKVRKPKETNRIVPQINYVEEGEVRWR